MPTSVSGIATRQLRREFTSNDVSTRVAVDDLDLIVRPGELVSILGSNGAGKTTTVRMLTGLLLPTAGEAIIEGYDVVRERRKAALACGSSLGGDSGLYPRLTALQNLAFFGLMYGMRGQALKRRAAEVLDHVNLTDRADEPVSTFSRGMRQRLHLARALLHKPPVLILDEPSAGLDPHSAASMRRLVRSFADEGHSVLLTTHDMREAEELSSRVVLMKDGSVHTEATPAELRLGAARQHGFVVEVIWNGSDSTGNCSNCPGLMDIKHDRGVTRLRVRDGGMAVQWLLAELGAQIPSLSVSPPTLEEVFLSMTEVR